MRARFDLTDCNEAQAQYYLATLKGNVIAWCATQDLRDR